MKHHKPPDDDDLRFLYEAYITDPTLKGAVEFIVRTVEQQYYGSPDPRRLEKSFSFSVGMTEAGMGEHGDLSSTDPADLQVIGSIVEKLSRSHRFVMIVRLLPMPAPRLIIIANDIETGAFRVYGCKIREDSFGEVVVIGEAAAGESILGGMGEIFASLPAFMERDAKDPPKGQGRQKVKPIEA